MKKYILIFSFFLLIIFSCKKNNPDPSNTGPSKTTLIAKTWLLTSIDFSPPLKVTYGVFSYQLNNASSLFNDCNKDDLYIFNKDKTFIVDEGATKCNSSDPQTKAQDIWSLSADSTSLIFNYNKVNISGKIVDLSNTTLKINTDAANLASVFVTTGSGFYIDPKSTSVATVTFTAKP